MILLDASIRILLCSLMLYGIYRETGVWTATFALVVIARFEIGDFLDRYEL